MTATKRLRRRASVEIDRYALRERRQDLGLTQKDLGDLVGLSSKYISQLEVGTRTRCSAPKFAAICEALSIPLDERRNLRVPAMRQAA